MAAPPLAEPAMVEAATRALPAVVLLVNTKPDGSTTYGAGLIVGHDGRVLALGHPQETVWSFTAGAVSALHNGAIQHDAVLSNGSSGGPLLNARGEVIGVNTARVTSESRGLSFARPIAMASRFIPRGSEKSERNELDQTSPEKAVMSCWHAHELSSPSVTECVDWDAQWQVFRSAIDAVRSPHLAPKTAELVARYGGASDDKADWIRSSKAAFADRLRQAIGCGSCWPGGTRMGALITTRSAG